MSFYADMAQVAVDLLTPDAGGGLGSADGSVVLVRRTIAAPSDPWATPTEAETSETLKAVVCGVSKELVGLPADEPSNGVIVASDRMVVASVPTMGFLPGDLVAVDSKPVTVMRVEQIPASGTPAAFRVVVRG